MKPSPKKSATKQLVVITGMSGAGKGSVIKAFEDLGFFCVDNLPVDLIPKFADLCSQSGGNIERAALVVDIRGGEALGRFPSIFQELRSDDWKASLVFLEASDQVLLRRFDETRRPHPLGHERPVAEAIRTERRLLRPIRRLASVVIDTTRFNVHELGELIQDRFMGAKERRTLLVSVVSFGYRYGVPLDSDLVLDVRFLPNPNYVSKLKNKTGKDAAVKRYVKSFPPTQEFLARISDLLKYLLPNYLREGKSYLTIGIGCTGGRHRSVALAEELAGVIRTEGYKTKVVHRDIGR